jgi:hypothetical protein
MNRCRSQLTALLTWGMIPLAVWSGLPLAACQCPDGGIRLFCAAMHAGIPAEQGPSDCHHGPHRKCCHEKIAHHNPCCDHSGDKSGSPCGKCKAIARATTIAVETVAPPTFDGQADGSLVFFAMTSFPRQSDVQARDVELLDTGPPLDLVLLQHCFLI